MIKTVKGNVLDVERGIIVHSCNNKGVMGSGIALEIKNRFPDVFSEYELKCRVRNSVDIMGHIQCIPVDLNKIIVNGIGQDGYGRDGKRYVNYESIAKIFEGVNKYAQNYYDFRGILLPICFPLIGCGFGGGKWEIISSIIDTTIDDKFEKVLYVL